MVIKSNESSLAVCPLIHGPSAQWKYFTSEQLFILSAPLVMRWTLRRVLSLAKVSPHQHGHSELWFKTMEVFIPLFCAPHPPPHHSLCTFCVCHLLSLFSTNYFALDFYIDRSCPTEFGGGSANQHINCNSGPECCPHLCHPGDAPSTHHLEKEWHYPQLPRPGGY